MRQSDFAAEIQEQQSVRGDQAKVGSAISGIIMFQVVLLALMGSNNSAREIAGERPIYEKEKFGGLRPTAYLASKIAFLSCLVIAQSRSEERRVGDECRAGRGGSCRDQSSRHR